MTLVFFDDRWLSIGLAITFLFALSFVIIVLGSTIVSLSPRFDSDLRRRCAGTALCLSVFALGLFWYATPYLYRFNQLTIEEDGTWHLENPFTWPIAIIPPASSRTVSFHHERYEPIISRYGPQTLSWVRIELPDGQVFESVKSNARTERPAMKILKGIIAQKPLWRAD